MIVPRKTSYGVRVYVGGGKYRWAGSFNFVKCGGKRRALELAKECERKASKRTTLARTTIGEYVTHFLAYYEREKKDSSLDAARTRLARLKNDHGHREMREIDRMEAKTLCAEWPDYVIPVVITMFNQAVEDQVVELNPFRGLTPRAKPGRAEDAPPTVEEFDQLRTACAALGAYGPRMLALLDFAAFSGMRPGEIYALEWTDIDFEAMRITVSRRMYKRRPGLPKNNKTKTIALTPPARDAVLTLTRDSRYVFTSIRGKQMAQNTLSHYWGKISARAQLDFDFYLATKHRFVHYLWTELELSERAIAAQMGWSLKTVQKMLAIYGHGDIGALEEIDRAFENVVPLRKVESA